MSKMRLLLVEDDKDFGSSLNLRLSKKNFKVTIAVTAEDALNRFKNVGFDIIVADIKLPGIDGVNFLAKVREVNKNMPIILLTGYGNLNTAKEAVKLNATDYLLKPLENIDELLNPIYKAVYSYNLLLENQRLTDNLQAKIEELEKSEDKYRDLFELAGDIIYIVNSKGIITSSNKMMEKITGYKKKELIGRPSSEIITSIKNNAHINPL